MKMIKFALIAAASLGLASAPAMAAEDASAYTGARVTVNVGTGGDDFIDFDGQTVGVEAGYDFDIGSGGLIGVGAEYQTDFNDDAFDVSEVAFTGRIGGVVAPSVMLYGTGGYSRIGDDGVPFKGFNVEGYRLGAGVELGRFKVEQRYSNYGSGVDVWQTVAGVNFRF